MYFAASVWLRLLLLQDAFRFQELVLRVIPVREEAFKTGCWRVYHIRQHQVITGPLSFLRPASLS